MQNKNTDPDLSDHAFSFIRIQAVALPRFYNSRLIINVESNLVHGKKKIFCFVCISSFCEQIRHMLGNLRLHPLILISSRLYVGACAVLCVFRGSYIYYIFIYWLLFGTLLAIENTVVIYSVVTSFDHVWWKVNAFTLRIGWKKLTNN